MKNLRERIEEILDEFYKSEIYIERQRKISQTTDRILQAFEEEGQPHTHGLGVCWCGYCGDHISLAGTGKCYQCGKDASPKYEKG